MQSVIEQGRWEEVFDKVALVSVSWGRWHSSQDLKLLAIYIYNFWEECLRHIKEFRKSLKAHFSEREREGRQCFCR